VGVVRSNNYIEGQKRKGKGKEKGKKEKEW
jgi:hypothetical protein